jgi:nucleoside-diphosphate-sugar epimerase
MIKEILNWEPNIPLQEGMQETYTWIEGQFQDRKAGKPTVS